MAAILSLYDWQQDVFQACENPDVEQIAVLGSRGPGKTWTCQHVNIARALQYPNTNHIIFRRTSDDIVKQYAPALKEVLNNFGGAKIPYNYNQTYKIFTIRCPNGGYSRIYLAFAEYVKHAEKYQGFEYMTLSFDESTHFEEAIPKRIGSSVRGDKRVKKLYFGNPGGIGHGWNKRWFIDPKTRMPKTKVFRPSLKQNLELAERDPGYAGRLESDLGGDEVLRKRWLDGDWDIVEGAYFTVPPGAICFVTPPPWADWWCGADWGFFPSAFACVWVATWRDPYTGRHRAHVYADLKRHKLNDPEQAQSALDMEKLLPVDKPRVRYADPSTRKLLPGENDEQTKSTLRVWAKYGFHCIGAKRYGRVPGWQLLRQFLAAIPGYSNNPDLPHGVLTISPNCHSLLEELQGATHDDESDDMEGPDHCLDSLRYLITMVYNMSFPQPAINAFEMRQITS